MANFRFHQISNTKKIRHISKIFKNSSFIVFLHGFMSDLEGKKPNAFLKFAKKNKLFYDDIKELLKTKYINPPIASLPLIFSNCFSFLKNYPCC